jgi:hypothetical protein
LCFVNTIAQWSWNIACNLLPETISIGIFYPEDMIATVWEVYL